MFLILKIINLAGNRTVYVILELSHDEIIVIESSGVSSHLKLVRSLADVERIVDCASVAEAGRAYDSRCS